MLEFFDPTSSINWYVAIRASEKFRELNGHYPGTVTEQFEADAKAMEPLALEIVKKLNPDGEAIESKYL